MTSDNLIKQEQVIVVNSSEDARGRIYFLEGIQNVTTTDAFNKKNTINKQETIQYKIELKESDIIVAPYTINGNIQDIKYIYYKVTDAPATSDSDTKMYNITAEVINPQSMPLVNAIDTALSISKNINSKLIPKIVPEIGENEENKIVAVNENGTGYTLIDKVPNAESADTATKATTADTATKATTADTATKATNADTATKATTADTATTATTATHLAGGSKNAIPYQTGENATSFLKANGTNKVLTLNDEGNLAWLSMWIT